MRRLLLIVLCLAVSGALAGCGNADEVHGVESAAHTEGIYLEQGDLKYQVQLSRILNPSDEEDKGYLHGLPESVLPPTEDQTYFAVFLRVENESKDETLTPAERFHIIDTQENRYVPLNVDAEANPFAYAPEPIAPGETLPYIDTVAAQGAVGSGSLLLFKLPYSTLQYRPLEFEIEPPVAGQPTVKVDLDV